MDTSTPAIELTPVKNPTGTIAKRQYRTFQEKRQNVEETLAAGAEVARIARGVTDLRRGFTGLSELIETNLEQKPFSGQVFVFRGRRGDLIKVLWYDGDGLCLFAKRLERGRFVWPQATSGTVSLTRAQLSMLLEGIDWRRLERTWDPQLSV